MKRATHAQRSTAMSERLNLKILNILKRRKKYVRFWLPIEPRSKGSTGDKSGVQKLLIEEMKQSNHTTLKGDIAVQIIAHT